MSLDSRVRLFTATLSVGRRLRWAPALWRWARARECDLIHSHGLWTDVSRLAGWAARRKQVQHVLAPCGMLHPEAYGGNWAKRWKKRVARFLFQDRVLREAACLVAKSEPEYVDLRRFGLSNPIAVIPNPVPACTEPDRETVLRFREKHRVPVSKALILFVGRLHPVKGLPRLLDAWGSLGQFHNLWQLMLAGPDENGHRAVLTAKLQALGCQSSVTFTGPLDAPAKAAAYAAADLFVMPSHFENFGTAIAEAIAAGLPVITTTGTPWRALRDEGCGWWVQPSPEALANALSEAMAIPRAKLREAGQTAQKLSLESRPSSVARRLLGVYRWLLGEGARPPCVRVD